jgi:hypothetical protein
MTIPVAAEDVNGKAKGADYIESGQSELRIETGDRPRSEPMGINLNGVKTQKGIIRTHVTLQLENLQ